MLCLKRMCYGGFVGMHRKVDDVWKKNSLFMMRRKVSGICIV